jgi:hypothetical protein
VATINEMPDTTENVSFRLTYIVLPGVFLLLSVTLAAGFYSQLPAEVAYHFTGGTPDRWLGRNALTASAIVLQLVFALLGLTIVAAAAMAGQQLMENTLTRRLLFIMGNIVALPQLILIFAMLDIFLYNIYQIHLIPVWIFALIVLVPGGMILGIFFIQAFRQTRGRPGKSLQE